MTNPAYDIPLTKTQLQTLGELCAIQGQVEYLMIETLVHTADFSRETARKILGSTGIRANSEIWIALIREKQWKDKETLEYAEAAYKLIKDLAEGRNDFVHAIFAWGAAGGWTLTGFVPKTKLPTGERSAVAIRIRNAKQRSADELPKVRDQAAEISRILDKLIRLYIPDDDYGIDYPETDPDNQQEEYPDDEPRSSQDKP
jgi:hypothetical protein